MGNEEVSKFKNGPVTWPTVLMLMALLATPAAILLDSYSDSLEKHIGAKGHEKLSERVIKLEEVVKGEGERNKRLEEWRAKHDREIIQMDSAQSIGVEQEHELLCILWSIVLPEITCPKISPMPRISP